MDHWIEFLVDIMSRLINTNTVSIATKGRNQLHKNMNNKQIHFYYIILLLYYIILYYISYIISLLYYIILLLSIVKIKDQVNKHTDVQCMYTVQCVCTSN